MTKKDTSDFMQIGILMYPNDRLGIILLLLQVISLRLQQ